MEKTAIVTGGTAGIGLAFARVLIEEGYRITIASRSQERLDAAAEQLGDAARPVAVNVMDEAGVGGLVAGHRAHFGRLDAVVNNVGGGGPEFGPVTVADAPTDQIDRFLTMNLLSAWWMVREALPALLESAREHGQAHVVNTGSMQGHSPVVSETTAYAVAKGGLGALTKAIHNQHSAEGIKVTLLTPSLTATPTTEGLDIPQESLVRAEDLAEGLRCVLRLSRYAVVPEIRFIRTDDPQFQP